ncbi:MAG: Gfo/Idh/MocA family oxidoreductase [Gemmatimonadetes bacterium]|nr:Gfo/Idh/MocA family oxidoreductase [Gemmatimonadota bacterium]
MKHTVRIGMIGAGHIAYSHAEAWRQEATLTAVASRRIERARALAERYDVPHVCRDANELLNRGDIDAVGIATPHHLHHPIAMAALKAGKSVFCEKPLALNGTQAREMCAAAETGCVKTGVQSGIRLFPALRLLSHLLREGKAGKIHTFDAHWSFDWARDPRFPLTWRFKRAEAGTGALGDLGVYMIDAARWLVGEIAQVNAELAVYVTQRPLLTAEDHFGELRRMHSDGVLEIPDRTGVVENDDVCQLLLRFENGARGSIRASRLHQEHSIRVDCERTSYL